MQLENSSSQTKQRNARTMPPLMGLLEDDKALNREEPWSGLLASAGPRDHIVQLYQDQEFLNRAVCRFAAGAIRNGEGVILVPTPAHWDAFRPRLEAEGVDVKAAQNRGQLTVLMRTSFCPGSCATPCRMHRCFSVWLMR